jgi:hypothetical protein
VLHTVAGWRLRWEVGADAPFHLKTKKRRATIAVDIQWQWTTGSGQLAVDNWQWTTGSGQHMPAAYSHTEHHCHPRTCPHKRKFPQALLHMQTPAASILSFLSSLKTQLS